MWIKRTGASNPDMFFASGSSASNGVLFAVDVNNRDTLEFRSKGNTIAPSSNDAVLADTDWHHIAFSADRDGNCVFYVDGAEAGTTDISSSAAQDWNRVDSVYKIATDRSLSDNYNGPMDEVRLGNLALSADWLETEFNNQNDTASFLSVGTEETVANSTSTTTTISYEWVELYNPSSNSCNLNDLYLSDYDGNLFDLSGGGTLAAGAYLVCHLGESGTNTSTDLYGPIINSDTSTTFMLGAYDDLSVKSSQGYIFDYLAWGADPGLDDAVAVSLGVWTNGNYVDTSELAENETIGRDKLSTDGNSTGDWENPSTNEADPYGIHSTIATPCAINLYPTIVINEILFSASADGGGGSGGGGSYDGWGNRKKITIDSSKVIADQTNFPVLINIVDQDLANRTQPDGDDIMFIASDETTKYNHEIESYDSSTGKLVAWVNITSLSGFQLCNGSTFGGN
jgi:hypothetical protein